MRKSLVFLGSLVLGLCGVAQADLNDGLIAYYPFNGNANDESGNGNDGVVRGATLSDSRNGTVNSSYRFDGSNDWIDFGDNLDIGSGAFTISVWVKHSQTNGEKTIISKGQSSTARPPESGYIIMIDGGKYILRYNDDQGRGLNANTAIEELDSWTHLTYRLSRDGNDTTLSLFVNGEQVSSSTGQVGSSNAEAGLAFGVHNKQSFIDGFLQGEIDDARFYNRALTNQEVASLYALESENLLDSDGDGLSDNEETDFYGTDPTKSDTDGDNVSDGSEILDGSNPLDSASFISNGLVSLSPDKVTLYDFEGFETGIIDGQNGWRDETASGTRGSPLIVRDENNNTFIANPSGGGTHWATRENDENFSFNEIQKDSIFVIQGDFLSGSDFHVAIQDATKSIHPYNELRLRMVGSTISIQSRNSNTRQTTLVTQSIAGSHENGDWIRIRGIFEADSVGKVTSCRLQVRNLSRNDDFVEKTATIPADKSVSDVSLLNVISVRSDWSTTGGVDNLAVATLSNYEASPTTPSVQLGPLYESPLGESAVVDATPISGFPTNFTYQWCFNGFKIPAALGGTNSSFSIDSLPENQGTWSVTITNSAGSIESSFEYRVYVDSDLDGLSNGYEELISMTDINDRDSDDDGLTDEEELNIYDTNPNSLDSDSDGFTDLYEVETAYDPNSAESVPDAQVEIVTAIEVRFNALIGAAYTIEFSSDSENWTTIEDDIFGLGRAVERFYSRKDYPKGFFRVVRTDQ